MRACNFLSDEWRSKSLGLDKFNGKLFFVGLFVEHYQNSITNLSLTSNLNQLFFDHEI